MKYLLVLFMALSLAACSHSDDDNGPILPGGDEDDRILNERSVSKPEPVEESSAVGSCSTYSSERMNSGRRLWKINRPLWKYARTASVRFNNGYYVPRVITAKANRINSGRGRGFVFRPGETTKNIIAVWAPYGNQSTQITVCLK